MKYILLVLCLFVIFLSLNCLCKNKKLIRGQIAPAFSLCDAEGNIHNLSDFKGKKIALFFYPKDGTPYCTQEACSLRDNYGLLEQHGITVIGISADKPKKHQAFIEKHKLPFLLLSDPQQKVIKEYGTKGFIFNDRVTFCINPDGTIACVIDKVNVRNHAKQIIDCFNKQK